MPSQRKVSKPKAQIDADWLLGPPPPVASPPTPRRNPFRSVLAMILLLSSVGAVALYWETWSQQVLRWQWERWLASDQTDEDTLAALVSIGDALDHSTILLIQQLQSTDPTRRSVAFQVLKSHCESPSFRRMDPERQREIVAAIEQLDPKDPDAIQMRSWIAARVMGQLASTTSANQLRDRLATLLNRTSDPNGSQRLANSQSLLLRGAGALPPGQSIAAKPSLAPPPNALRDEAQPNSNPESPPSQPPPPSREPTRIRIAGDSNVKTISTTRSVNLSDRNENQVMIEAKRDRSVGELLQTLEREPDHEVARIVDELHAKGFSEQHVELAMALARGTTEDRLLALEAMPKTPGIHQLAWLVWMAESQDPAARMKAIAMLGSSADPDAIRHLQRIQQRESDPRIADHLRQALIANGAAPSSTR